MKFMKKIFFIFILIGVLAAGIALATPLENNYPVIGNSIAPSSTNASVPVFLKYMFNFSLIGAALIVFGALVFGGIKYIASAGNPGQTGAAKDMIFSAFLGLGVVLFSWMFLNTINPHLTSIELPSLQFTGGVKVTFEDGSQRVYSSSVGTIDRKVASIEFQPGDYDVCSFSLEYWKGTKTDRQPGGVSDDVKSIKITSKIPGVYLCYTDSSEEICDNYIYSAPNFGDKKGKYEKIKMIEQFDSQGKKVKKYTAVLYNAENYGVQTLSVVESANDNAPAGTIPANPNPDTFYQNETVNVLLSDGQAAKDLSSIKVSVRNTQKDSPGNVSMWKEVEFKGESKSTGDVSAEGKFDGALGMGLNDNVRSIKIEGSRYALLCKDPCSDPIVSGGGRFLSCNSPCQTFTASDADLTNDYIGRCKPKTWEWVGQVADTFNWGWLKNDPCATYFIVRTTARQ